MFSNAYLAPKQLQIWSLRREGKTQAEIGRVLGVQRQGVYEQFHIIDAKVGRALMEAAQSHKLDIHRMDTVQGILEAYSPSHGVPAIVSLSKANGIQVWYQYEGKCAGCSRKQACLAMLRGEAAEREIPLGLEDLKLTPTQLGKKIFTTIRSGMEER